MTLWFVPTHELYTVPLRICSSVQDRKSKTLMVPSSEQVASLASVGEKLLTKEVHINKVWSGVTSTKGGLQAYKL